MFHRIHFTALKQYTLVHRGVCTSTPIRGERALLLLHCCGIWHTSNFSDVTQDMHT